jgi:hypothetical protein
MLIIVDKKIPSQAKTKLSEYGQVIELETSGITYNAISGHPDIFFHQAGKQLIVAPNLPEIYKKKLLDAGIKFAYGEQDVGAKYPTSSAYNVVSTDTLLIHNFRNTDSSITSLLDDNDLIHVDQGYTRCNLLALNDDHFITSDDKVQRVMERFGKDCLYVDPAGIVLEDYKHGFFGGCCGNFDDKVFILGSLTEYPEGEKVRKYITDHDHDIVELCDGPLFDGGSILFIE